MDIVLSTPPDEADVLNLVSVADLKVNERISHTQHDATLLPDSIKAAYAFLDGRYGWLNRSILTQSWTMWFPRFQQVTELKYGPVQSVTSVKYFDADGVEQTLSATAYEVTTGDVTGHVYKKSDTIWPVIDTRQRAVSVEYVAGFGDAADIPFPVKQNLKKAILLMASHYYRNPSATYAEPRTLAVNRKIEYGLESLIGFLRVPPDYS